MFDQDCDYESDYYQILGVSSTADSETLNAAYRKRARECHPDRGGSHEKMVQLNTAFRILSHPETRRHYDELRVNRRNSSAHAVFREDVTEAARRAEEYPRNWSAFEKWFDNLTEDFSKARYGSTQAGLYSFPTAGESKSGLSFIVTGAAIGAVVVYCVVVAPSRTFGIFASGRIILVGAVGGAWIGSMLHKSIGRSIMQPKRRATAGTSKSGSEVAAAEKAILRCPKCDTGLRVPRMDSLVVVTCTSCKHRFSVRGGVVA